MCLAEGGLAYCQLEEAKNYKPAGPESVWPDKNIKIYVTHFFVEGDVVRCVPIKQYV